MTLKFRRACFGAGVLLWCGAVDAEDASPTMTPAWPNTLVYRVEALALLQTLNAELLSHDSATATLERWCGAHGLASPAKIVAERLDVGDQPPSADQRRELQVGPDELVRYRQVKLRCGPLVLSRAENWYVPGRLTAEMNRSLDATDTPFGKVVQALHFQRHTLSSKLLWSPLPGGWEMQPSAESGSAALEVPPAVLEHRAVLAMDNGMPFSEVVETYTSNVLAFAAPGGAREPPTDGQPLVGAWRLAAIEYRGPHGETTDPFYQAGSSGIIIYEATGWMSVQIGAPGRQGAPVAEVRVPQSKGGGREKARAYDTYYSYYGTWDFDAATSTVTHHLESSLIPEEAGMSYAQTAAIEGGRLVLTVRTGHPGHETLRRKVWERLTPAIQKP